MKTLLTLIRIAAGLMALGAIWQEAATRRDRRRFPPPGTLVDVDGYQMHMVLMGMEQPGPTVILDAGMVSFSSNWAWVQPEVAKVAPVVAYDRAGLGWSDPRPEPRDAAQSARELHDALTTAGIGAPYVVVGHSYGGLTMRAFADRYSDDVVGMVLVDASHPDQWRHIPVTKNGQRMAAGQRVMGLLGRFGLFRLWDGEAEMLARGLPERPYAEIKAFAMLPRSLAVSSAALALWDERTRPQVNGAKPLGDLPLVVISVTEQAVYADVLTRLQAALPALSSNSRHITVEGASHERLVSDQQFARVVTDAILEVVEAARTGARVG